MSAIRDGFLWLVPCLLLSALLLILSTVLSLFDIDKVYAKLFHNLYESLSDLMPYLVSGSIAYMRAIQYRLVRPPVVFLCASYVIMSKVCFEIYMHSADVFIMFFAIIIPLIAVPLLAKLLKYKWMSLVNLDLAGRNIQEVLNLIIPSIITALVILLLTIIFHSVLDVFMENPVTVPVELVSEHPYLTGVVFTSMNSLLWFIGVHGSQALQAFVLILEQAVSLNQQAVLAGSSNLYLMNSSFLGAFVFLGGSGATFSLISALLIFSKDKNLRIIAVASIPIGLLNVNELLLFALPIILNPRLFLPFIITPVINVFSSLAATEFGLVDPVIMDFPFTAPIFANAYLATDGDINAVVLQISNIIIGTLIYFPFVKKLDYTHKNRKLSNFKSLETYYTRREEEAIAKSFDPVTVFTLARDFQNKLHHNIQRISDQEFYLEFQPQVKLETMEVMSCEALVRSKSSLGNIQSPAHFLPWLREANLMKELDLWVVKKCREELLSLIDNDYDIGLSINISKETLESEESIQEFLNELEGLEKRITIEITEESLVNNSEVIINNLSIIRQRGVRIAIDDFGTGFSSLSYLYKFDIDEIKIDRSFVQALKTSRGQRVFKAVMHFIIDLDLTIVIEGIETSEELSFMSQWGDLLIQGRLISNSLTNGSLEDFLENKNVHD